MSRSRPKGLSFRVKPRSSTGCTSSIHERFHCVVLWGGEGEGDRTNEEQLMGQVVKSDGED